MKSRIAVFFFGALGGFLCLMNGCGEFLSNGDQSVLGLSEAERQYIEVRKILSQRCTSCHSQEGNETDFELDSMEDFIAQGLIVPGKPLRSKLIYRLKNFQHNEATANNMPLAGPPLAEEQYLLLYNWVLNTPENSSPFRCDIESPIQNRLTFSDTQKLSAQQYAFSLRDLFSRALNNQDVTNLVDSALLSHPLPADSGVNFTRDNNQIDTNHMRTYYSIADDIASKSVSRHLRALVLGFIELNPGDCRNPNLESLSDFCVQQFLRNFVGRAFRRPLREGRQLLLSGGQPIDELQDFFSDWQSDDLSSSVNRLIFRTLLAPHFLMQIEDQNSVSPLPPSDSIYRLDSFAIASRLSYRYWNSPPDETLWDMAEKFDLFEEAPYALAVEHIFTNKEKLARAVKDFTNDWLRLDDVPIFEENSRFAVLRPNINFGPSLRSAMIDEVNDLSALTVTSGESFSFLFTSNYSVTNDSELMSLYGLTQPVNDPLNQNVPVRFPASTRSGLLSRAALLISGDEITSPIHRGYQIRKNILCLELNSPPADALDQFAATEVPHLSTARQRTEIGTSPSACIGCHQLINPLGFALGHFDAFGGFIEQEPIFSRNDENQIETYLKVDAHADLSAEFGPGQTVENAGDLGQLIADQITTKSCFSKKILSFSFYRSFNNGIDACRAGKIFNTLGENGRLVDAFKSTALDFEMRLRRIDTGD